MEKYIDIKKTGIPNVCFSLSDNDEKFAPQRVERGFDDSELWSLSTTIAQFMIPRLKRYQELSEMILVNGHKRRDDVNKLIRALELELLDVVEGEILTESEHIERKAGLAVFPKIFMYLWL